MPRSDSKRHHARDTQSLGWGAMTESASSALIEVLREARAQLARPGNDYSWASWEGPDEALRELDSIIASLERDALPSRVDLDVLFAPTGPIQEVSLSSGWGQEFIDLAARFDAAMKCLYETS
jgi:hypothetical protein